MQPSRPWFLLGLFFTTAATLCLEILDTRLFSVISWYHLSFFAVSTAMFGMSAGALRVYLSKDEYEGSRAVNALHRIGMQFALVTPLAHVLTLVIPIHSGSGMLVIAAMTVLTVAVAAPFYLSGILITLCLTRVPGRIGLIYAVDLLGAALGTLLVIPLLQGSNITSAILFCSAIAAAGALCFRLSTGSRQVALPALLVLVLCGCAFLNKRVPDPVQVWYQKGSSVAGFPLSEYWNIHSRVLVSDVPNKNPAFWGPGEGAERFKVAGYPMIIDGSATTKMSRWDGRYESLEWTEYDLTSLPYHLRKEGAVAVIGVGGGRDVLSALRARSKSVHGIEINKVFIDLLEGERRKYAGIAERPEVIFVHDEARSFLTRTPMRFDVLQMSLIDTWASTGVGAMTLTENGLYTREAWKIFLDVLQPTGLFSVSRWFDPERVSETSRLLVLCTSALLERGVTEPARNMAVVLRGRLATLLVSPSPLSSADLATMDATAERLGFEVLLAPDRPSADPQVRAIVAARSQEELARASAHEHYDYSVPTDERPFFFNLLKPGSAFESGTVSSAGVVGGNLVATVTLSLLFLISLFLVLVVIFGPLAMAGLPRMPFSSFLLSVWYFAAIGLGFMFVQIPTMQRFSIYLGHPTYAVVVILFSMILATGVGSLLSDRLPVERDGRLTVALPLAIACAIGLLTLAIQPVIDHTIRFGLLARCAVVVAMVAPVALLLGFCFPIGMRLVARLSEPALPWMWGVNGACGVFAAVSAVAISMWWGIHTNLFLALGLYASLALVAPALLRRGQAKESAARTVPAQPARASAAREASALEPR